MYLPRDSEPSIAFKDRVFNPIYIAHIKSFLGPVVPEIVTYSCEILITSTNEPCLTLSYPFRRVQVALCSPNLLELLVMLVILVVNTGAIEYVVVCHPKGRQTGHNPRRRRGVLRNCLSLPRAARDADQHTQKGSSGVEDQVGCPSPLCSPRSSLAGSCFLLLPYRTC